MCTGTRKTSRFIQVEWANKDEASLYPKLLIETRFDQTHSQGGLSLKSTSVFQRANWVVVGQ